MIPLALAGALLLALVTAALAQTSTVPVSHLYELLTTFLLPIVSVLAAAIAGWLANLLRVKFGLEIEQKHRDALQTALANAAGLAIAKGKDLLADKSISVGNPAVADAVNYVVAAVPDALKYFGLTPERVAEMVQAKIGKIEAGA